MGRLGGMELVIVAVILSSMVFWAWTFVDCLRHEPAGSKDRLSWIVVLMLGGCVGSVVYLVLRRPQRLRESELARAAESSP
ncbi:MAG: PLDc N-terminal domain-containing protein [Polyangiaceae bacterium]